MIAKLLTKLLGFILNIIGTVLGFILSPIINVITANVPDLHNVMSTISNFIDTYVVPGFGYFPQFLGPVTKSAIKLEFDIIAIFFVIYTTYVLIYGSMRIIHKVKSMFM